MNKYQDILFRHSSTKSHAALPNTNLSLSALATTPRGYESSNLRVLSPTNNISDFSKLTIDTSQKPKATILNTKSSSVDHLPKSKNISEFSAKQNEIITSFLTSRENHSKTSSFFPDIYMKNCLPTEREFSKLIENLNEVVIPKNMRLHTILQENDPVDAIVPEGKTKYFKMYMKQRKVPLSIKIKRTKGKFYAYTSKDAQEPGPTNYDKCYISDYIEIRDSTTVFKYDMLYLGIKAFEESQFRIVISFGRQINSLQELKRLKRQSIRANMQESFDLDEEEELIKETAKNDSKLKKNFIIENKQKSIDYINKATILNLRAADWKVHREQIVQKKKEIVQLKKTKALDTINKKSFKKQIEKLKAKENIEKAGKTKFFTTWLSIISLLSCSETIHTLIITQKTMRLNRISLNIRAVQIQKTYKNYTKNISLKESAILRSRNLLLIFRGHLKDIEKKFTYGKNLISIIKKASQSQVVYRKFSHFYKSLVLLQRNIRKYLYIKKYRIRELVKMWTVICESMLFRKGSKKDERKRHSAKLITIPAYVRDEAIRNYYRKCAFKFRETRRKYFNASNSLTENKKLHSALSQMCGNSQPVFVYLPSVKEMETIVESALEGRFKN